MVGLLPLGISSTQPLKHCKSLKKKPVTEMRELRRTIPWIHVPPQIPPNLPWPQWRTPHRTYSKNYCVLIRIGRSVDSCVPRTQQRLSALFWTRKTTYIEKREKNHNIQQYLHNSCYFEERDKSHNMWQWKQSNHDSLN